MVIGFIEHLLIVSTSNYSALASPHTLQFITARKKYFQFVFTSRFLITDPNNVLCLRTYLLANVPQLTKLKVTLQLAVHLQSFRFRELELYYDQRSVGQSVLE
jgi:hypothetical protein